LKIDRTYLIILAFVFFHCGGEKKDTNSERNYNHSYSEAPEIVKFDYFDSIKFLSYKVRTTEGDDQDLYALLRKDSVELTALPLDEALSILLNNSNRIIDTSNIDLFISDIKKIYSNIEILNANAIVSDSTKIDLTFIINRGPIPLRNKRNTTIIIKGNKDVTVIEKK